MKTPEEKAAKWCADIAHYGLNVNPVNLAALIRADRLELLDELERYVGEHPEGRHQYRDACDTLRAELAEGAEISNGRPLESTGVGPAGY